MGKRNLPRRQLPPTYRHRHQQIFSTTQQNHGKQPFADSGSCYPMMQFVTTKQQISNAIVKTF